MICTYLRIYRPTCMYVLTYRPTQYNYVILHVMLGFCKSYKWNLSGGCCPDGTVFQASSWDSGRETDWWYLENALACYWLWQWLLLGYSLNSLLGLRAGTTESSVAKNFRGIEGRLLIKNLPWKIEDEDFSMVVVLDDIQRERCWQ